VRSARGEAWPGRRPALPLSTQVLIGTGLSRPWCCSSLPRGHEGAGRVSSAVGSACAGLRQLLRVFTRPVIGRFSRLGLRSSRAHLTACAPGALAPSPLAGSIVQEGSAMPFPGPPGSIPRRQCIRSSLRLATGCGSAGVRCTHRTLGHAPVATGFLAGTRKTCSSCPDASNATPTNALPS